MNTRRQAGRGPGKRLRPTGRIVLIRDHRVLAGPRPVAQIPAKHRKVSV